MARPRSKRPDDPSSTQEPAWSVPDLRDPRYSQSLERRLAILDRFTSERPVLGIADIADEEQASISAIAATPSKNRGESVA